MEIKPLLAKDKAFTLNPKDTFENFFKKYWVFDGFFAKSILILMLLLSIYAVIRMFAQGVW